MLRGRSWFFFQTFSIALSSLLKCSAGLSVSEDTSFAPLAGGIAVEPNMNIGSDKELTLSNSFVADIAHVSSDQVHAIPQAGSR